MAICDARRILALPVALPLLTLMLAMLVVTGWQIAYVADCSAESENQNLFDYVKFYNCATLLPKSVKGISLVIWLVLLVSCLGSTADVFFVPLLEELSERLQLTEEVAGVTLLALGNGMPDIMTASSAISGDEDSLNKGLQLAMGEFLGGGCFIMMMILGAVLCCSAGRTQVEPKMFLVNVIAYMVCVALMFLFTFRSRVQWWHSLVLFAFYFAYVSLVIGMGWRLHKKGHLSIVRSNFSRSTLSRIPSSMPDIGGMVSLESGWDGTVAKHASKTSKLVSLAEQPCDSDETQQTSVDTLACLSLSEVQGFLPMLQFIMEFPFSCLRALTIPSPGWSAQRRRMAMLHPFLGLCVILFAFHDKWGGLVSRVGPMPAVVWAAVFGAAAALAVLAFSTADRLPRWHTVVILFGVVTTVAWFNIFANEVVAVLESLGKAFSVSDSTLGITVLAWGNCVGDFAADVALAKAGKSKMAVAGLFGSLIFSDALGLGVSLLSATLAKGSFSASLGTMDTIAGAFLLSSLLLIAATFSTFRFCCPRWFCIPLLVVYLSFMITSVVVELVSS